MAAEAHGGRTVRSGKERPPRTQPRKTLSSPTDISSDAARPWPSVSRTIAGTRPARTAAPPRQRRPGRSRARPLAAGLLQLCHRVREHRRAAAGDAGEHVLPRGRCRDPVELTAEVLAERRPLLGRSTFEDGEGLRTDVTDLNGAHSTTLRVHALRMQWNARVGTHAALSCARGSTMRWTTTAPPGAVTAMRSSPSTRRCTVPACPSAPGIVVAPQLAPPSRLAQMHDP